MNIIDLGKKIIGMGLPLLGAALGGAPGGLLGSLIGHALGLGPKATPAQIGTAIDADPAGAKVKLAEVQNQHAETMARIEALQVQATQTGQTMRIEYGTSDPYVRRWRPTWGYVAAAAWGLEALAIVGVLVGATVAALMGMVKVSAGLLIGLPTVLYSMTGLWAIALAVLGDRKSVV